MVFLWQRRGACWYSSVQISREHKHWASLINQTMCLSYLLVLSAMPVWTRSCHRLRKPTQSISIMIVQIADEITQSEVQLIHNSRLPRQYNTTHHPPTHIPVWPSRYFFFLIMILDSTILNAAGYSSSSHHFVLSKFPLGSKNQSWLGSHLRTLSSVEWSRYLAEI